MTKFDHLRGMVEGYRKLGIPQVSISLETMTELLDIAEGKPSVPSVEDPEAPVQLFEADGETKRPWDEVLEEMGRKNKALREREANGS